MDEIINELESIYGHLAEKYRDSSGRMTIHEYQYRSVTESEEWKSLEGQDTCVDIGLRNRLLHAVLTNPRFSYYAGTEWSDSYFDTYVIDLVSILRTSSQYSFYAGLKWIDKRFTSDIQEFTECVAQSPVWSYIAGEKWSDKRFNPFGRMIAQAVARDPECEDFARKGSRPKQGGSLSRELWGYFGSGGVFSLEYAPAWKEDRIKLIQVRE